MDGFEYELRKNGGPSVEKNHTRNRLMDRQQKKANKFCALVKLYHTDPKVEYISKEEQREIENKILADDLTPCVVYSMNKKGRWELLSNMDGETLQNLEDENGGLTTIVLEKQLSDANSLRLVECSRAYQNVICCSYCKTSHKLENTEEDKKAVYRRRTVRGIGQTYPSFSDREKDKTKTAEDGKENGKEETVVTYNIVTIPKNFKKLYEKHFIRKYSLGYPDFLMYDMDSAYWWVEHELAHSSEAFDMLFSKESNSEPENLPTQKAALTDCYRLVDHIVSKPSQKERRQKQRSRKNTACSSLSSDFSIISGYTSE